MTGWLLLLNDEHSLKHFSSENRLRKWGRERGRILKRSPIDRYCFYTEAVGYVPGNPRGSLD